MEKANREKETATKTEAEFYRVALELGLCETVKVIAWCDSVIMAEDEPDFAIIEASLSGSGGRDVVSRALMDVQGEFDRRAVSRRFLSWLLEIVTQDRAEAPRVAYLLSELELAGYGTGDEKSEMDSYLCRFDDATDPDVDNPRGVENLTDELIRYLEQCSR